MVSKVPKQTNGKTLMRIRVRTDPYPFWKPVRIMVNGHELQRTYNGAVEDHTGGSTVGLHGVVEGHNGTLEVQTGIRPHCRFEKNLVRIRIRIKKGKSVKSRILISIEVKSRIRIGIKATQPVLWNRNYLLRFRFRF